MAKQSKTNAMRLLDGMGVPYRCHEYGGGKLDAVTVAKVLGQDPGAVLKTLVAKGRSGACYVFLLPGEATLDLKKAAKAAGEKSVEMLPHRELLPLTGYVPGGCSPIGMKKPLPAFLEVGAAAQAVVYVSAGRIGTQLELRLEHLLQALAPQWAELAEEREG